MNNRLIACPKLPELVMTIITLTEKDFSIIPMELWIRATKFAVQSFALTIRTKATMKQAHPQ